MTDMPDKQGERVIRGDAGELAGEAALVIDPRLADLWQLVWSGRPEPGDGVPLGTLAALLRLAYALGYTDALTEDRVGLLYEELGLRSAARPSRSANRSRRGRAAPGSSGR